MLIDGSMIVGEVDMLTLLFAAVCSGLGERVSPALRTRIGRAPVTLEQFARHHADLLRARKEKSVPCRRPTPAG